MEGRKNMKKLINLVLALAVASSLMGVPVKAAEMNWTKTDNTWYATDEGGNQIKGWYKDQSNCWYMLDWTTGAMRTGWVASGTEWYYMNPANGIMQTGWQTIAGKQYYLLTSGAKAGSMAVGDVEIQGKKYRFDDKGVFVGELNDLGILINAAGTDNAVAQAFGNNNRREKVVSGFPKFDARIQEILDELNVDNLNDFDAIKAIHDWVAMNLEYGQFHNFKTQEEVDEYMGILVDPEKKEISDGMYEFIMEMRGLLGGKNYKVAMGALIAGKGVCDQYAYLMTAILQAAGFKASYLNGKFIDYKGISKGHVWNVVWSYNDNCWYNLDAQYADWKGDNSLDYSYFMKKGNLDNYKPTIASNGIGFDYTVPLEQYVQQWGDPR